MSAVLGRVAPGLSSKFNLLVDLILLLSALAIATVMRVGFEGLRAHEFYACVVAVVSVWVVTATALRHYDPFSNRGRSDDVAMVVVLVAAVATVIVVIKLFTPSNAEMPGTLTFVGMLLPALVLVRLFVARPLSAGEDPLDEVLIVGTGSMARITANDIEHGHLRRKVVGYLSLPGETPPRSIAEKYLGTWEQLSEVLENSPVDEVYIAADVTRFAEPVQSMIKTCETLGTPFALPAYSFSLDRARPADTRSLPDGYLHYLNVEAKPTQMAMKRLFDIVASGVALWLLLPLLLTVALIIKLTSRGPVFFRQVRVGLHGKTFHMLKFRSMVVNAEELKEKLAAANEMSGPVFKMKNDPRITWIGRFIRKFSIDELPQLLNVLRGEMTIVGPRPPLPKEVAQYKQWQRRRLSVRPGLTCIWQVSGRNQISFEEWMYLDMQYIDTWSLGRDLGLIFQTVPVVITGRGAS